MIKYFKVFIIILALICLVGCSNVKFEQYNGERLSIGVIGEIPKVREGSITFNKIDFKDLEEEITLSQYDAIFITKEHLVEVSEEKYASIYNECRVPFFFIEDIKGHIPFVNGELTYEDVPQLDNPPPYAVGILKNSDGLIYTGYGLYNDTKNKKSIEDVYSRIFTTISENKHP